MRIRVRMPCGSQDVALAWRTLGCKLAPKLHRPILREHSESRRRYRKRAYRLKAPLTRSFSRAGGTRTHDLLTPSRFWAMPGRVAVCRLARVGWVCRSVPWASVRPVARSMQAFRRRDTTHTYQHAWSCFPRRRGTRRSSSAKTATAVNSADVVRAVLNVHIAYEATAGPRRCAFFLTEPGSPSSEVTVFGSRRPTRRRETPPSLPAEH